MAMPTSLRVFSVLLDIFNYLLLLLPLKLTGSTPVNFGMQRKFPVCAGILLF
jgi:hypothetical protein